MQTGTILIVDDNKSVLTSLELLLEREFEKIETVSDPNKIFSILDEFIIDLVILDMNFSVGFNTGNEGLFWLQRIHEIRPELPVIMLTAYGDIDLAVKSLKSGAADFVLKPWNNDNLIKKIRTTLQEAIETTWRFALSLPASTSFAALKTLRSCSLPSSCSRFCFCFCFCFWSLHWFDCFPAPTEKRQKFGKPTELIRICK